MLFLSTPLYFYKADYHLDTENKLREIYYKETELTDNGLKHPASMYFPFQEKLGLLLLRFLNADLSTFETANKTFFYAYGFEILRNLDENYKFELKSNYGSNEEYLQAITKIFEDLREKILDLQQELIKAVTYIYSLDNNKTLEKYTSSERYAVYLIKRKGKLYTYYKNDLIIRDSYSKKYNEFANTSEEIVLEELSKTPNYPIKKCQNCGMYFIPTSKTDEVYCDYPKENSKTCRELGAFQSYTERLKQNKAMGAYRRNYKRLFAQVKKNKGNKKLAKEFEIWKKQAKEKINLMKKGVLTEDEVYQWILRNK